MSDEQMGELPRKAGEVMARHMGPPSPLKIEVRRRLRALYEERYGEGWEVALLNARHAGEGGPFREDLERIRAEVKAEMGAGAKDQKTGDDMDD